MKRRHLISAGTIAAVALGLYAWQRTPAPAPTLLSFRIGQSFDAVVETSTYAVVQNSLVPREELDYSGGTFVTEPAVALCFNDPQHGFILPPTKFALVAFAQNVVVTMSTSPSLEKLPFDRAVLILEDLQNQFKAGGWEPWKVDGSVWFDLTPEGRKRLYQRMFEPGYSQSAELRVPKKYGMTFRLKCTDGCWPDEKPPYLFLVDVGVGSDTNESEPGDPEVWDKSFPGNAVSAAPARFRCPGAWPVGLARAAAGQAEN